MLRRKDHEHEEGVFQGQKMPEAQLMLEGMWQNRRKRANPATPGLRWPSRKRREDECKRRKGSSEMSLTRDRTRFSSGRDDVSC